MNTTLAPTRISGGVTPHAAEAPDHGRLLAEIALAARWVATARPLDRFVGLNPLAGVDDLHFSVAAAGAGQTLGVRGTPHEAVLRREHARGRITRADLDAAARAALLPLAQPAQLELGGATVNVVDLIIDDLVHGPLDAPPARRRRTLAEAMDTKLAAQIDRRTARWCAAYVDAGQAVWSMPGRERGLYRAWRALDGDEPGAPAPLRAALRAAPDDPAAAVHASLMHLGVPDDDLRSYLESHLSAQPGWAAHFRWREQEG